MNNYPDGVTGGEDYFNPPKYDTECPECGCEFMRYEGRCPWCGKPMEDDDD